MTIKHTPEVPEFRVGDGAAVNHLQADRLLRVILRDPLQHYIEKVIRPCPPQSKDSSIFFIPT